MQQVNSHDIRNRRMGDNIFGDEDHQQIAREALPILIEKAKARQTINYSTLAHELDIAPFGYPMPEMLGSIVTTLYETTLYELGERWQKNIPRITSLVVSSNSGYPSFP